MIVSIESHRTRIERPWQRARDAARGDPFLLRVSEPAPAESPCLPVARMDARLVGALFRRRRAALSSQRAERASRSMPSPRVPTLLA
jgi:hypothetical protein